ncbi:hypothetical protein [Thermogemmatispora onikobensis]|uniref:hypothetical protein n=1 Tax=Thermogemmatispora onikobensis TaxID=732234 RepID=UPI00159F1F52|nr:hypothetical protein [Thermogemmatispora onikobensis]
MATSLQPLPLKAGERGLQVNPVDGQIQQHNNHTASRQPATRTPSPPPVRCGREVKQP